MKKLDELIKLPLVDKVEYTKEVIKEFYELTNGNIYVAFSGGKDSTVLLSIVRDLYPDCIAVFSNTTNEYTEILQFIKTVDNVIELRPKQSFTDILKEKGFPLVSKKVARQVSDLRNPTLRNVNSRRLYMTGIKKDGGLSKSFKLAKKWHKLITADFDVTNKCCDILKKHPMREFEKKTGLYPIIGTQAMESSSRKQSYLITGDISTTPKYSCRPLSIWTEDDIWAYIKKNNIPYSSIYDDIVIDGTLVKGETRTGCAYCAFGVQFEKEDNRFNRLLKRKPKQATKMLTIKNNGVSYGEALKFIGVDLHIKEANEEQ